MSNSELLVVASKVLPDAIIKVAQAKQLLAQGKAKSLAEATRIADISRSTFYKYRDYVFAYQDPDSIRVVTIHTELVDKSGVLSSLLSLVSSAGGNILTINQNIPIDGVALVSITVRCDMMHPTIEEVIASLSTADGVVLIKMHGG